MEFKPTGNLVLGILGVDASINFDPVKEVINALVPYNITGVKLIWELLCNEQVSNWPRCDVLLLLSHADIVLDKVKSYIDLVKCTELNAVHGLELLRDRASMYRQCEKFGIPIPDWVECNRDGPPSTHATFIEELDRVIINGKAIEKPFVEKPRLSDDHSVYIYFPQSAGGGRVRLYRRERHFENTSAVRKEGSFVYQRFVASEGFETKLYAIGTEYVHAEAVPSRVSDRNFQANLPEKNVPVPIHLRPAEKIIPVKVGLAFGLTVFKLHVLRTQLPSLSNESLLGKTNHPTRTSVLFDISIGRACLVRKEKDYYHDFASALATEIGKRHVKVTRRVAATVDFRESKLSQDVASIREEMRKRNVAPATAEPARTTAQSEDHLRCVIALVRHGDRTCKQKLIVKFHGSLPDDIASMYTPNEDIRASADLEKLSVLLSKYRDSRISDLAAVINAIDVLIAVSSSSSPHPVFDNLKAKIERNDSLWIVKLKWGGDLTPVGIGQAESAGRYFRKSIYDPKDNILHMHASMHHDLKVYASEERRCQQTAASFAKGLLELSSQLPVLQTTFVRSDGLGRLDTTPFKHSDQIDRIRRELATVLFSREDETADSLVQKLFHFQPSCAAAAALRELISEFASINKAFDKLKETCEVFGASLESLDGNIRLFGKETLLLMRNRWNYLIGVMRGLKESDPGKLSAVGSVFDSAVYDCRHNLAFLADASESVGEVLKALRTIVRKLYTVITPLEYGVEAEHKAFIGATFLHPLIRKFRWDVRVASGLPLGDESEHLLRYAELYSVIGAEQQVRTRLYFAHHSHMISFLNVVRFGYQRGQLVMQGENMDWLDNKVVNLGYLSQIILQLYQNGNDWILKIRLMPGDELSSPHGSIQFATLQHIIFTARGSIEVIDDLFTNMLNIVSESSEETPQHLIGFGK